MKKLKNDIFNFIILNFYEEDMLNFIKIPSNFQLNFALKMKDLDKSKDIKYEYSYKFEEKKCIIKLSQVIFCVLIFAWKN